MLCSHHYRRGATLLVWFGLLTLAAMAFAEARPRSLSYQGYLKNADGTPATSPQNITFGLYSSKTVVATAMWSETHNNVPITNGVYSVLLGETNPFNGPPPSQLYLGVQVGASPVLTPLQPFASVPFALLAYDVTNGSVTVDKLADNSITSAKLLPPLNLSYSGAAPTITGNSSDNVGVKGASISFVGIQGESGSGVGVNAFSSSGASPAMAATQEGSGPIITGSKGTSVVFKVDNSGVVVATGLALPATTTSTGIITAGGNRLIHSYGTNNFFAGTNAGNLITNNTGSFNTAVGTEALNSNTSGTSNVALGYRALYANTTAGGNIAVGVEALRSNTSGAANVALGTGSLYGNGSGTANVALGDNALYTNTIGSNNAALGYRALFGNIAGSDNTALGFEALYTNSSAGRNTAIGSGALFSQNYTSSDPSWYPKNTAVGFNALHANNPVSDDVGVSNTAVGYAALSANATGRDNTALGVDSLKSNTAGFDNTAMGIESLSSNTYGMRNTAIGSYSLSQNDRGENNTAIGSSSLANSVTDGNTAIGAFALNTATTGYNNSAFGYGADVAAAGASNATAIGFNAKVNASNKVRIGDTNVTAIEGQVAWSNPSDIRLKTDIAGVTHGIDFIKQLRPVEFRMKQGNGKKDFGFIAQEIEALLGTDYNVLGIGGDPDRTLTLRYTDFIAPLVKAVQEQQAEIEQLKAEVATLKQLVLKNSQ